VNAQYGPVNSGLCSVGNVRRMTRIKLVIWHAYAYNSHSTKVGACHFQEVGQLADEDRCAMAIGG
jgi:hypothetical protein